MRSLPLALACAVTGVPAVWADTELTSDAGSAALAELEHRRELVARPLWVEVTDRHRFQNSGRSTVQLVYRFDLGDRAVISAVEVSTAAGRAHKAVAIDSAAAVRPLPEHTADAARSDLALLRQIEAGRYELTIYPLDPGVPVSVTIRAIVPAQLTDGRMSATLPARGADHSANLARTRVTAKTAGWRSVRKLDQLTLNGQRQTNLDIARGDRAGLAIQARAVFGRTRGDLDLGLSSVALDGPLHALAVAGIAPPGSRVLGRYVHVVLLVDVSRSMGRAGVRAAATVADAILANLPATTRVAVIPFDRTARPLDRGFVANDHRIRGRTSSALTSGALANGSDVLAALDAADKLLGGREARRVAEDARAEGEPTAAVIAISDAETPLALTPRRALDVVSQRTRSDAAFFAVTVAREGRSFPRPVAGALDQLVARTGGAAFAVRAKRAAVESKRIARELGIANQLFGLRARLGQEALDELSLPDRLAPGSGFLAVGPWVGAPPRSLEIKAARRGGAVSENLRRSRDPGLEKVAAALLLAGLDPGRLIKAHERAELRGDHKAPLSPERDASRQIARAGARHAAVTPYLSLVVPHPKDRFAREQLAFARKWGSWLYRRAPTPSEIAGDLELRLWRGATGLARSGSQRRAPRINGSIEPAIMRREIRSQLFRRVRNCYDRQLRGAPRLRGSLTLQFDIADGEVRAAEISAGSIGRVGLRRCVVNAAYQFKPPQAANDHATTYIVRYPFRFRVINRRGAVSEDDGSGKQIELDADDPLDGIN